MTFSFTAHVDALREERDQVTWGMPPKSAPPTHIDGSGVRSQGTPAQEQALREGLAGLSQLMVDSDPEALATVLRRVAHFAVQAIPGAAGAGVALFAEDHRPHTLGPVLGS